MLNNLVETSSALKERSVGETERVSGSFCPDSPQETASIRAADNAANSREWYFFVIVIGY
jgi:hypothetical protein